MKSSVEGGPVHKSSSGALIPGEILRLRVWGDLSSLSEVLQTEWTELDRFLPVCHEKSSNNQGDKNIFVEVTMRNIFSF